MVRFTMFLALLVTLMLGLVVREEKGTLVIERETSSVIGGNNPFALELFSKLRSRPGNVAVSPASVSNALALTYEGARGQTAEEIARVLHLPADREATRAGFHASHVRLNGDGSPRPYVLNAANSLWGQQGDPFLPDYLKQLAETYGAGARSLDFRGNSESARQTINAWVDDATRHMIRDLLKPNDLTPAPSLVLVNTVYFKADWSSPFPADQTKPADFHVSPTSTRPAPMMHLTATLPYFEADGLQVVQMPYKGGDFAMVVLLPRTIDGLDALESSLTPAKLDRWLAGLGSRRVAVGLPKFKANSGVELSGPLGALGMPTAFTSSADFSGINGRRDLFISKVIHQVVVDVDEQGTEAAAASAVMMRKSEAVAAPPVAFKADHPFLYLIRDLRSGTLLFLGRIAEPPR